MKLTLKQPVLKQPVLAYKLLHVRKNGTLGSLFINKKAALPAGVWLLAEGHRTKNFAYRPGWHATHAPSAPHLSMAGRRWYVVQLRGVQRIKRPESQGGVWYVARWLKILDVVNCGGS